MGQNVAKYKIGIRMKKCRWSRLFVLQGVWLLHRINIDEGDESLLLLAFRRDVVNAIFLKYSNEGRLSSTHLGIRNIPSHVCYDETKHYQVQSEHKCIQNPFKHLRGSVLSKQLTA